ncbi:MAG: ABC transporter substrate-binding protein [Candidatus Methanoperedens sp.]|nr:ABC transporter substrate-binding protein [Candidatus Methanoperedens sp.]
MNNNIKINMNNNNTIKLLSIITVVAILLVGSGCLTTENTQKEPATIAKQDTVVIRILDSPDTASNWDIMKKLTGRDILEEEGVKLEYITSLPTGSGTTGVQSLLANNVDYPAAGSSGPALPVWINAIGSGGKIKVVHGTRVRTLEKPDSYWVVLENSSISTVKDFVDKKIAVNTLGAESDYATRFYLKNNGISIDQVQLIVVPSAQHEQVLRTKQVDIAVIGEQQYQIAKKRGGIRTVTDSYQIKGKATMASGAGFREDFIKEHPGAVKGFVRVYEKSQRLIYDEFQKNPESVKKAVSEILKEKGGNPELGNYYLPTFVPDHPFMTDDDVQWWIDRFIEDGKLNPGQIKPSDIYTNEFNPYYKK